MGALLGGLSGGLLSGLFGYYGQQSANEANIQLWREQSEYNKPINQMARLKEAGLNPNLAYGQVAESKASSPPQVQAYKPTYNPAADIAQYQQIKNLEAQNQLIAAQTEAARASAFAGAAQANRTAEETRGLKYENDSLISSGLLKSDPLMMRMLRDWRGPDGIASQLFKFSGEAADYIKNLPDSMAGRAQLMMEQERRK